MDNDALKKLHHDLLQFHNNTCTGCDTCCSTESICNMIVTLQIQVKRQIKENDENGK